MEKASGKILGAHLIGPGAEEQINLLTMAMGAGLSANQVKGIIFAYPSYASDLGSMVRESCVLKGNSLARHRIVL